MKTSFKNNFLASLLFLIACLSHLVSINLFYSTVFSTWKYCLCYFGITLLFAFFFVVIRRAETVKMYMVNFFLFYVASIVLLGGILSNLFLVPNYFLANKNKFNSINCSIVKTGYATSEYSKDSYCMILIFKEEKKLYFNKNRFNALKEGKNVMVEYYDGYFGAQIIKKVVVFNEAGNAIFFVEY